VASHATQLAAVRAGTSLEDEAELSRRTLAAWDTVGWIRFRQGRLAEAERWLAATERLRPSAVVSGHLCAIREQAGRTSDAVEACARAAATTNTWPPAVAAATAARARLEKLLGDTRAAEAVARARTQLEGWRRLPAGAGGRVGAGTRLELVVAADGTIAQARGEDGSPIPEATAGLRGARLDVAFPDPAVPALVIKATWDCAVERCAAVFEP